MPPAAIIGGMALAGAAAGAFGKQSSSNNTYGVNLAGPGALETQATNGLQQSYSQLQGMVNAGPGQQDVSNGYNAQLGLANAYKNFSSMPTGSQFQQGNMFAQQAMAPQQTALNQAFQQQGWNASNNAAAMGRSTTDPILQAKLAQSQINAQSQLSSQQGAMASQYAQQQPYQQLDMQQRQAGILSGLATQAMSNRQSLASMGDSIMGQEQNFRLATAQHYGNQQTTSGGGVGGAITGAMQGFGAGAGMANGMGGGGGESAPSGGGDFFGGINPYGAAGSGSAIGIGGGEANSYGLSGPASYGGGRDVGLFGTYGNGTSIFGGK